MSRRPSIGIAACPVQNGLQACHISGNSFVRAPGARANGLSTVPNRLSASVILDAPPNLLLTRSSSTVEPFHYSGPACSAGAAHDSARDSTASPLPRRAVAVSARTAFASGLHSQPQGQVSSSSHVLGVSQVCQRDADASNNARPLMKPGHSAQRHL